MVDLPKLTSEPLRILNTEPLGYSQKARRIYEQLGRLEEGPVSRTELVSMISNYDVILIRLTHQIDKDILERAQRLRVIVTPTTGLDHIDLDAAEAAGVAVLSLRDEGEFLTQIPATAEHTWGLLLALTRRIPWAFEHVLSGGWNRDQFRGVDLSGRRIGLLGMGRIGGMVAGYAQSFGMKVTGFDPCRRGWIDGVGRAMSAEALMSESDVLSVHVHLTPKTQGLLGKDLLRHMPAHSLVINTSRGDVLVEDDLVEMLEAGHVAGAAVDVLLNERGGQVSPLLDYAIRNQNLIITPHIAGATTEAMESTEIHMARLLARFLQGDPER